MSPTPPAAQRDDREARGHRFEDHVAEGLGEAGEREQVGRRVVVGQVLARPVPDESRVRAHPLLDLGAGRAVAHEQEPHVVPRLGDAVQGVGQVATRSSRPRSG